MSWEIGYDSNWKRDIGYGVPSICDHPNCNKEINRGLGYVCGGEPYGGEHGCGLFFCGEHKDINSLCEVCRNYDGQDLYKSKPDTQEWMIHKLTDPSWGEWRKENPDEVLKIKSLLDKDSTEFDLINFDYSDFGS